MSSQLVFHGLSAALLALSSLVLFYPVEVVVTKVAAVRALTAALSVPLAGALFAMSGTICTSSGSGAACKSAGWGSLVAAGAGAYSIYAPAAGVTFVPWFLPAWVAGWGLTGATLLALAPPAGKKAQH